MTNLVTGPRCLTEGCQSIQYIINAYIEDENGFLIGHDVVCKGCEKHFELRINEPLRER